MTEDSPADAPPQIASSRGKITALAAFCVALTTLFFATASADRFPLTWDEGDAFSRAERVGAWLDALALGPGALRSNAPESEAAATDLREGPRLAIAQATSRRELFTRQYVAIGFPHLVYREGHPAGYSIMIAVGARLARAVRVDAIFSEKVAYRFGGICLLTLATTAVFLRASRSFGVGAGLAAVVGTISCPHVFGHALIGGGDSLLISSWLLAWSLFPTAERRTLGAVLWGLALGASFSAKFSGFLLVAPFAVVFVLQSLLARPKRIVDFRVAFRLALGVAIGLVFFWLVSPPLWFEPVQGLETFLRRNTHREFLGLNIPSYFFGKFYSLDRPLPWWNGFFWVVATVPFFLTALAPATLALTAFGRRLETSANQDERAVARLLVFAAFALGTTFPITRAFPGVPVHDGVRLLVASTSFWGLLGGLGAALTARRLWNESLGRRRATILRFATTIAFLAPGVADLILIAPQYLSFYSAAVGGLVGASRLGHEPTFYWDAFDDDVAARLRELTRKAQDEGRPSGVLFGSFSSPTLYYYKLWGTFATREVATISEPTTFARLGVFGFYVTQRRPSGVSPFDAEVAKRARPVLIKRLRDPLPNPFCRNNERIAVLEVYDIRVKPSDASPSSK